jgi:N-acyl homoserine lactone hydrolase
VSAADGVRVHAFSSGAVREKATQRGPRRYFPGGWAEDTLPVKFFLIDHPAGLCLFDTGQTAAAAEPGYFPRWHPFLRLARFELEPSDEAGAQLSGLGHDPGSVRWVVLSHMHTDHVGGIEPFSNAEIVVARSEWDRFPGLGGRIRGYLPQHWPAGVEPSPVELHGPPVGPFSGSLDLAGDGSLLLVPLPGHTPGHIGLLVEAQDGSYLLGGDVAHSPQELAERHPELDAFCRRRQIVPLLCHDKEAGVERVLKEETFTADAGVSVPGPAIYQRLSE